MQKQSSMSSILWKTWVIVSLLLHNKQLCYLPLDSGSFDFYLYDMLGRQVRTIEDFDHQEIILQKKNLSKGLYVFKIENKKGQTASGKIMVN